ncbi:hypothetical protein BJY01DRAFT_249195 [Aspergillus pseudoustus]|uniref:Zn(2)-C6 fungal-type domain-containing protein n=1 Tax=Aspergillus pseudoustus TaxID=1810923 RepID=A0ABR4JQ53_9EURO
MGSTGGVEKPALLACTECRRKHLRCDATVPTCMRCTLSGAQCQYLPSRQGLKRRSGLHPDPRPRTPRSPPSSADGFASLHADRIDPAYEQYDQATDFVPPPSPDYGRRGDPTPSLDSFGAQIAIENSHRSSTPQRARLPEQMSPLSPQRSQCLQDLAVEDDDVLINLFYSTFHPAHPILVPRQLYASQAYPACLKVVVHSVGSQYFDTVLSDELCKQTAELLFSIILHARNEIHQSTAVLAQSVSLALDLGMHTRSFAADHTQQNPHDEESLRRTWWELYVTDGFMAVLQRRPSFRCQEAHPDVYLPCDDNEDEAAADAQGIHSTRPLPPPRSLVEFDARVFAHEEISFSTFTYRIEAVRLLARVVAVAWTHDMHVDTLDALDSALAAWPHHIDTATASRQPMSEALFQAHLLVQFSLVYLHFPRSDLVATVPGAARVIRQIPVPPVSARSVHGEKALAAAKQLSKLIAAMPDPAAPHQHTPFFVCAVAFPALVQLSACSLYTHSAGGVSGSVYGPPGRYRDHIALGLGVLRALAPTWELARVTLRRVRSMAAEVLSRGGGGEDNRDQGGNNDAINSKGVVVDSVDQRPIVEDSSITSSRGSAGSLHDLPLGDLPWLDHFLLGGESDSIPQ